MAKVSADPDYAAKKAFFLFLVDELKIYGDILPDVHPALALERLEKLSASKAKMGLDMAIDDTLEEILLWPREQVAAVDVQLAERGLMTITAALGRYSERIEKILKRGKIKGETEHYLLKGVRDGTELLIAGQEKLADRLLVEFEVRVVGEK